MDKTYAETQGKPPFDWNLALEKAPQMDWMEKIDLVHRSKEWVSCACGNQCAIIPRHEEGQPEDKRLQTLGGEFFIQVRDLDWEKAKDTLTKIEARSEILIRGELAKLNANP